MKIEPGQSHLFFGRFYWHNEEGTEMGRLQEGRHSLFHRLLNQLRVRSPSQPPGCAPWLLYIFLIIVIEIVFFIWCVERKRALLKLPPSFGEQGGRKHNVGHVQQSQARSRVKNLALMVQEA
jgi:hypothetical protein